MLINSTWVQMFEVISSNTSFDFDKMCPELEAKQNFVTSYDCLLLQLLFLIYWPVRNAVKDELTNSLRSHKYGDFAMLQITIYRADSLSRSLILDREVSGLSNQEVYYLHWSEIYITFEK